MSREQSSSPGRAAAGVGPAHSVRGASHAVAARAQAYRWWEPTTAASPKATASTRRPGSPGWRRYPTSATAPLPLRGSQRGLDTTEASFSGGPWATPVRRRHTGLLVARQCCDWSGGPDARHFQEHSGRRRHSCGPLDRRHHAVVASEDPGGCGHSAWNRRHVLAARRTSLAGVTRLGHRPAATQDVVAVISSPGGGVEDHRARSAITSSRRDRRRPPARGRNAGTRDRVRPGSSGARGRAPDRNRLRAGDRPIGQGDRAGGRGRRPRKSRPAGSSSARSRSRSSSGGPEKHPSISPSQYGSVRSTVGTQSSRHVRSRVSRPLSDQAVASSSTATTR